MIALLFQLLLLMLWPSWVFTNEQGSAKLEEVASQFHGQILDSVAIFAG